MADIIKFKGSRYLTIALFLFLAYISWLVLKPFVVTIISSGLLAYVFYPLYEKLVAKTGKKRISSIIMTLIILLLILVPFVFVTNMLTKEAYSSYVMIKERFGDDGSLKLDCENPSLICTLSSYMFTDSGFSSYLTEIVQKGSSYIINSTSNFLFSIPGRFLELFVLLFVLYYLFVDGEYFMKKAWAFLPIKSSHKENIAKKVSNITYAVIYGYILTALLQGAVAGIGYFVVGLSSPLLWTIMTALVALLPFFGSAIVWFPISVYIFINGLLSSSPLMMGKGVGLFIYGIIIISGIDNIVRPKLIGGKSKVHPAIVLIGVLGGLVAFGFIGILLGPLILVLLTTFMEIYQGEG
ncbi:AI-2E family transporter [Candidatus Woesearchaeota archaeon]|nr:AI-2E family transporter [Candidatus Woesearchaeota archaeon]